MTEHELTGSDASDPLGLLAAVGLLRVASRASEEARLRWHLDGRWQAHLALPDGLDPVDLVVADLDRWRGRHAALDFAVGAERKTQDLKPPPAEFRELMRSVADDPEAASFLAAYATGVAVDGSGQTKPTSLHFCAGQQLFLVNVLDLRDSVTREDIVEALYGPWVGRVGPKDTRWRAASERLRALLSFDPGKEKGTTVPAAAWLAFQAMPLFPAVPVGTRVRTTGFSGRGKHETFAWPVWTSPLSLDAVRVLLGTRGLVDKPPEWRAAMGVGQIFEAAVVRSSQGYGNFAAANVR